MTEGANAHTHLQEIDSPKTRYKLEGYQEASYSLDEEVLKLRRAIDEKRGVVQAAAAIAKRLLQECDPIAKAARDEEMEPGEAKIRIDVVKRMSSIVQEIATKNQNDLITFQGMIQGIERSRKVIEGRFKDEVGKYERWKRIESEEADEAAPPPEQPEADNRPVLEAPPKTEAKAKPAEKGKVVPLHKKAPAKAKAKAPQPGVVKAPGKTVESEAEKTTAEAEKATAEDRKAKLKQVLGKRKKKAKAKAPAKE